MKYLKSYKLYESVDDLEMIKKNCQDILLPLTDKDIKCAVNSIKLDREIIVNIGNGVNLIDFNDFSSDINHLLDYLHDEGFKLGSRSIVSNLHWEKLENLTYDILNDILKYPDNYSIEFISMIFEKRN